MSLFALRTRAIWQTGHLPGHPERTPGSIGQQYSVSADTAPIEGSRAAGAVERSQYARSTSQPATIEDATIRAARNRRRTCAARTAQASDRHRDTLEVVIAGLTPAGGWAARPPPRARGPSGVPSA